VRGFRLEELAVRAPEGEGRLRLEGHGAAGREVRAALEEALAVPPEHGAPGSGRAVRAGRAVGASLLPGTLPGELRRGPGHLHRRDGDRGARVPRPARRLDPRGGAVCGGEAEAPGAGAASPGAGHLRRAHLLRRRRDVLGERPPGGRAPGGPRSPGAIVPGYVRTLRVDAARDRPARIARSDRPAR